MDIYQRTLEETYKTLGDFSASYAVDRKRYWRSLTMLDRYGGIRGKRVLDLGSGIGILAIALKKLGATVVGMDKFVFPRASPNPYKVQEFDALAAVWGAYGIEVVEGDILERFPFPDESFDAVNCDATIEHLPYAPKGLFAETYRVLKPGGVFFVTTPNSANLLRRIRFLIGRNPNWDVRDYFMAGPNFTGHRREFTARELTQMLEWSKFSDIRCVGVNAYFNVRQFLAPKKFFRQLASVLSMPFSRAREMLYACARKK